MKPSIEQVQSLLALKRHESPPEGYVDDFLREFHQRRREEAVGSGRMRSLWATWSVWFEDRAAGKWLYGAGLAYAGVLLFSILAPQDPPATRLEVKPAAQVIEVSEVEPLPTRQLDELDLRPSTEGTTGEQEF